MTKQAERIENIAMNDQILMHAQRWGYASLIQTIRPGKYVIGTDIVARLLPTAFTTKRAAQDAADTLIGDYLIARRAN